MKLQNIVEEVQNFRNIKWRIEKRSEAEKAFGAILNEAIILCAAI